MSRSARVKSFSGVYHVMLRGMDRHIIFLDDMDRLVFTKIVERVKRKSGFKIYAYCLMDNHVHMLLREEDEPLEMIFKRIGVSYVSYYNKKYDLYGHLYQDRFKSEPIDSAPYFLDVLRYICRNPLKAGLCDSALVYAWLECSKVRDVSGLIDDISEYTSMSGETLRSFISVGCDEEHLEIDRNKRLTDADAVSILCRVTCCSNPLELTKKKEDVRNASLVKCLNSGISIRQLARITGISKNIIERVKRKG